MEQAADNAGDALRRERDELSAKANQTARDLDAAIEETDRKLEKATAKEKARWETRRKMLVKERDELKAEMDHIGDDMKDGWNDFKSTFGTRLERIGRDIKN